MVWITLIPKGDYALSPALARYMNVAARLCGAINLFGATGARGGVS